MRFTKELVGRGGGGQQCSLQPQVRYHLQHPLTKRLCSLLPQPPIPLCAAHSKFQVSLSGDLAIIACPAFLLYITSPSADGVGLVSLRSFLTALLSRLPHGPAIPTGVPVPSKGSQGWSYRDVERTLHPAPDWRPGELKPPALAGLRLLGICR